MNKNKIKAASRKALIAADKSYYSWPPEQQEKFRASMNEAAQNIENFDPKVVKLKKKMKVVMTPEALHDLSKDDDRIE